MVQEAGCDDVAKELVTASVATTKNPAIPLGTLENCAKAIQDFAYGACTSQHGTITQQSGTAATCLRQLPHDSTLVASISCDGKTKEITYCTTSPSRQPYATATDCEFNVEAFKKGQEGVHPGACNRPNTTTTTTPNTTMVLI